MPLTYRLLDVETEWPQIEAEFTKRGSNLPNPELAMIMGAFRHTSDNSIRLVGFLVCQLQFHFEPIVLAEPIHPGGLFHALETELSARVGPTQYFACVPADVKPIAVAMGMTELPYGLYIKSITPTTAPIDPAPAPSLII